MPTFAELTAREDVGVVWLLEVSSDNFATVSYRYGTAWGKLDGTNIFESRLVSVGRLQRGFAVDHGMQAATVSIVLDNVDGGADWLCNRSTVESTLFKSKFRLKVGLYEPGIPTSIQLKTLGVFTCLDYPVRQLSEVSFTLADDSLNAIADLAISPSISDWLSDAGSNSGNCPLISAIGSQIDGTYMADAYTPTRLAWGVAVDAYPVMTQPNPARSADSYATRVLMVCATRETGSTLTNDVGEYVYLNASTEVSIHGSRGFAVPVGAFTFKNVSYTVFTKRRTQTLSKDGKDWKLIWIEVRLDRLLDFLNVAGFDFLKAIGYWDALYSGQANGNWFGQTVPIVPGGLNSLTSLDFLWEKIARWEVDTCGSSMTLDVSPCGAEIVKDLVGYYARGGDPALVDSTSFNRAIASQTALRAGGILADFAQAAGAVSTPRGGGLVRDLSAGNRFEAVGGYLRGVLVEICQSFDMDLFSQWDGTFALALLAPDFDAFTATHPTISETKLSRDSASDRIASTGERWSPVNRVYIEEPDGSRSGPYDYGPAITAWGRVLTRTISAKWRRGVNYSLAKVFTPDQLNAIFSSVWGQRALEARARPILSFRTKLEALQLELGAYFRTSWSRGLSVGGAASPYSNVLWKVESLALIPDTLEVEVVCVWSDDLLTDLPYLLDDEDYLLRVAASGGRTATVQDSVDTVTFSSGDLVADGVAEDDILVLLDSTQDPDVFTRFRAIRIKTIDSADTLTLDTADLDFDSGGGVAVAAWKIVRSYATYPTVGSDPANYPSGGTMYGKITDDDGLFSDATDGNKLLDG